MGRGRIVLVLDALNQVEGDEPDRSLAFLPRHLPPHVRLVASALPGPALDAWRERGWVEHPLPLPDAGEWERMIDAFLSTYRKRLGNDLRRTLVSAPGAANPLFRRTVLEELRQFGGFEQLPARLEHYLVADTPEKLFRRVLGRWQADFDAGQDLVRASRVLWAARQGLAEAEWLELLGAPGQPLARRLWRPLFLALESHLVQRCGPLGFGQGFFRRAVQTEFLTAETDQRDAHLAVANYFQRQPISPRRAGELPYHWLAADRYRDAAAALTERETFSQLYSRERYALIDYWRQIEPNLDSVNEYELAWRIWTASAACVPSELAELASAMAGFFREGGKLEAAEVFLGRAFDAALAAWGREDVNTVAILNNLAGLRAERGDRRQAALTAQQAVTAGRRAGMISAPGTHAAFLLASLNVSPGDLAAEEEAVRSHLPTVELLEGPDSPGSLSLLVKLARVLHSKGDRSQAGTLYREAIEGFRRTVGDSNPRTAGVMALFAILLREQGDLQEARPYLEKALASFVTTLGRHHPQALECAFMYSVLLAELGEDTEANRVLDQSFRDVQLERILGNGHPVVKGVLARRPRME